MVDIIRFENTLNNLFGISIFADEAHMKYKDMYTILNEIAEIYNGHRYNSTQQEEDLKYDI